MAYALPDYDDREPEARIWFGALQSEELSDPTAAARALALVSNVNGVRKAEVYEASHAVCFVYDRAEARKEVSKVLTEAGFSVQQ